MADFASIGHTSFDTIRVFARTVPNFRRPNSSRGEFASVQALVRPYGKGAWALGFSGFPPINPNNQPSIAAPWSTAGFDWFDHVHILPRTKIQFGNIITTVTAPYELFNAYRQTSVFVNFVNNVGAGVTVPNLPAVPYNVQPLTSILDPTSVRLAPVRLVVSVSTDGPANFDNTLDFTFAPGGTLHLALSGSRISLMPLEFDGDVEETLGFRTAILTKVGGREQRISQRPNPRQSFDVVLTTFGVERQTLQALFFGWQSRDFGIPLWHERFTLSAAILAGGTAAVVLSTANADFRVGGLAILFKTAAIFDVLQIVTITGTTITFASATVNAYAIGDALMPLRVGRVTSPITGRRFPVNVQGFKVHIDVEDNDTGAPAGDVSAFSSYLTKVLLDDPNIMAGNQMNESYEQRLVIIDNNSGQVYQASSWNRHKHGFQIGFAPRTRVGVWNLRRLLLALRGRAVSFYAPTFNEDLTVTQPLGLGSANMTIANIGYAKYVAQKEPKATFRITFTDGTKLIRIITASSQISAAEELLTLNTTWPANRLVATIVRVEFLENIRLDSDDVKITYQAVGRAHCYVPAKVVFDV